MIWKSNVKIKAMIGDKKQKIRFAVFPVKINNTWIWLEKYISNYEFKMVHYSYEEDVADLIVTMFTVTRYTDYLEWCFINRELINKN